MPRAKKTEQWEANSTIEKENIVHKDGIPKGEPIRASLPKQKPAWTIKGSQEAKERMSKLREMKKQKKEQK